MSSSPAAPRELTVDTLALGSTSSTSTSSTSTSPTPTTTPTASGERTPTTTPGGGAAPASLSSRALSPPPPATLRNSFTSIPGTTIGELFLAVSNPELELLQRGLDDELKLLASKLQGCASHYFRTGGKRMRPALVLLLSRALSVHLAAHPERRSTEFDHGALANVDVEHAALRAHEDSDWATTAATAAASGVGYVTPRQRRLAEVVEMIHTASLFHDDVVDEAPLRRGQPSALAKYGNKLAVLGGDYVLARSFVVLARIQNHHVASAIGGVVNEMVEGEFMQLESLSAERGHERDSPVFRQYLVRSYKKTAALFVRACRATAYLAGVDAALVELVDTFASSMGLAFQIVDDVIDVVGKAELAGKEVGVDMRLGLATAPVLFTLEHEPSLRERIERRFKQPGDVDAALAAVRAHDGVQRSRALADEYKRKALDCLLTLERSDARDALVDLVELVCAREK